MKSTNLLRKTIYIFAVFMTLAGFFAVWYITRDTFITLLISVGFLFMFLLVIFMDVIYQSYTDKLLLELSDLVQSIINMSDNEIFSDVEDTLVSKLQSQVLKLSSILKAHNKAIKSEKDEIQSLISDISHQIKTPVASIKIFGDLLQEPDLDEAQRREYLQMLDESLNKLAFLIDSLIKMSRLESGIIRLRPQAGSLNDTILQAVQQVYYKAKQKDMEIIFDEKSDIMLKIDDNWTAEALFNILDNAVKYTRRGGTITITVHKYEFFVRVDIADNGIGISEEEQPKIFQRFYRGQETKDIEGVGIGLYLTRKIVTDQGGYLKVSSNDKGSTFSVFLPLN